ncbi:hypothetical protein Bca4012_084344 [Brassica carinata]
MNLSAITQGNDNDAPAVGNEFAQFAAGCFWGVELAFQRVNGVTHTEVGYTQGTLHNPSYDDVCTNTTNHAEVVRVQYDPKECNFESLLDVFWSRHDPTTLNRQNWKAPSEPEVEKLAAESMERHQQQMESKIMTEILPAKKFYRAEEYHQQYLSKGGQSCGIACNSPLMCSAATA